MSRGAHALAAGPMTVISANFGASTVATAATVGVRLPAVVPQLAMVRALTDTVCLVADFPLDAAADIRLAVNEIATVLIREAVAGATLECEFTYSDDRMTVRASTITETEVEFSRHSLGWELVRMLASSARSSTGPFETWAHGYPTVIEFSWERGTSA
ncbi:ATP-binding protein [Nocardia callitridis]|uniref:Anti-sigma factor n=1 Tax=Nocardia callitridis TaxID=648753 RepID=A0ABP9KJE5_9NOCA